MKSRFFGGEFRQVKWVLGVIALLAVTNVRSQSDLEGWKLHIERDGVKVYFMYSDCDLRMGFDERRVLLKYENTTNEKRVFTYHADLYYGGECKTCNDPYGEYTHTISLEPHTSVTGECTIENPGYLGFFVRWVNQPNETELTKFEFSDIDVSTE